MGIAPMPVIRVGPMTTLSEPEQQHQVRIGGIVFVLTQKEYDELMREMAEDATWD